MKNYERHPLSKSLEQNLKELLSTIRLRENDFIAQLQSLIDKEFSTSSTIALRQQKIQSDKLD